jgi:hypothetical protein
MVLLRARAHHPSLLTVQYHMGWWLPLKKNGMEARSVGLDIRAYLISASSSLVQVVSFQFIQIQISDLICMLYLRLIILSMVNDVPIDSEVFLMTDFINFKIKPVPSFKDAHGDMIYVYVFIGMSTNVLYFKIICFFTVCGFWESHRLHSFSQRYVVQFQTSACYKFSDFSPSA